MMPGSKGQKAVHACMIRLLNLGPAKHEEEVICVANQRIPNVCRIAGAACCGAIRGRQLGAKDLLPPTSYNTIRRLCKGITEPPDLELKRWNLCLIIHLLITTLRNLSSDNLLDEFIYG